MIVEVFSTLLCQLRSQTRPHSATIVGSVKVRFWQVATLTMYFHYQNFFIYIIYAVFAGAFLPPFLQFSLSLSLYICKLDWQDLLYLVVKAGIVQGLLAPAAGEGGLPPHKDVLHDQEGSEHLRFNQAHFHFHFSTAHLEKTEDGDIFDLLPARLSNLKEDTVNLHGKALGRPLL